MKGIKILIATILVALIAAGAASADGTVDITSTAAVDPATGAYILTVGLDSYTAWNLQAVYAGFNLPGYYQVQIREGLYNPVGPIAYSIPITAMALGTFNVPLHWVPLSSDEDKIFTVWAYGTGVGTFKIAAQVTEPVPEMNTGILMSAGLIGLVGLTRYRRKE